MGVGARRFQTFLCDACGREVIAEEGVSVDGYYLDVQQVRNGNQISNENVFSCSELCIERAIRDALKRATLPEEQKLTATQELWLKGRQFATNPAMPVYDATDETRVIGTAREIDRRQQEPKDALDPNWKPEFQGRPQQ